MPHTNASCMRAFVVGTFSSFPTYPGQISRDIPSKFREMMEPGRQVACGKAEAVSE